MLRTWTKISSLFPITVIWESGFQGVSLGRAKAKGCLNWEWPDKYGHYRVARYTQIKHHWWWKVFLSTETPS